VACCRKVNLRFRNFIPPSFRLKGNRSSRRNLQASCYLAQGFWDWQQEWAETSKRVRSISFCSEIRRNSSLRISAKKLPQDARRFSRRLLHPSGQDVNPAGPEMTRRSVVGPAPSLAAVAARCQEISPTTKPLSAGAAAELHPPHLFICIY
jgi:hypothetical protein